MPNIRPFNALIPAPHLQAKVVTWPLEAYSTGEAKLIASENDCSFLHLINPELDNPYLRGTRQELVFKKINENLNAFLEKQVLVKQDPAAVFIYRVSHDELTQTGIWTLTDIEDYLQGKIKKHEHTVERRERLLAAYLEHTHLDANPVLVTYPPDQLISTIMEKYVVNAECILDFNFVDQSRHQVWAMTDHSDLTSIFQAFEQIPCVYIADGHHRIASMAKLPKPTFFSTVYMNTKEIKVLEFNRLVRDLGVLTPAMFLEKIKESFVLKEMPTEVKPQKLHEIGMYFNSQWFKLMPKKGIYNEDNPVEVLDVSILQNFILGPVLSIDDPRTDARITFSGGRIPVAQLQKQVDNGLFAVAFTLFPVAVEQIIEVADASGTMPPKSTWIEPKFLVGLITNYL
ncbi:DUF1015 domain-containing protein [Pedobacter immunditicola]|uniref:DUF1015 domain-containing protein n=1 Tax=Pedobacter immunditicola TaxID=3133440 RepID=UPI0030A32AC6